jgi:pyruvate/2-oxoglutarate dehydrogenase complex dihydrolipoamide acyltransferase (E2) component
MAEVTAPAATDDPLAPRERDRKRLPPLRKITIRRLAEAQAATVPVTIQTEADGSALLARKQQAPRGATVTALLAELLARTLVEHPDLNCALDGEELVRFADVNLGIAVALEDGNLSLPIVHRAQERDLADLAAAIADASARAREGKLGLEDVRGGTFTLSNVGMLMPALWGAPLIPLGQAGIVLTGGFLDRPVVRDGAVVPGCVLPISFTFDHRLVNGAPALAFLRALVAAIEQPAAADRPS